MKKLKSANLRKGRSSQNYQSYFITICTTVENSIATKKHFKMLLDSFLWFENSEYIDLSCLILMSDHIHVVFSLTGNKTISEIIKNFKSYTSKTLREQNLKGNKFWQKGFFDHRIRNNERFHQIIYYCYNNPYKAGLLNSDEKYPYWYCKPDILTEMYDRIDYYRELESLGKGFDPRKLLKVKV